MTVQRPVHTIALIIEPLSARFEQSRHRLKEITATLIDDRRVIRTDLFLIEGDILLVLYAINPEWTPLDAVRDLADAISAAQFRILDLSVLSPQQLERFFEARLRQVRWESQAIDDIDKALEELSGHLSGTASKCRRATQRVNVSIPVEVVHEGRQITGEARNLSIDGIWIACQDKPPAGDQITIRLRTDMADRPLSLQALVVHTDVIAEPNAGQISGFGARFVINSEERRLLESYVVAQTRCVPWPGPSGRRFERFPIRLRVIYDHEGTAHSERIGDLSRGGVFVSSENPPPVGTVLALRIDPPRGGSPVEIHTRVVHRIAPTSVHAGGFGAEFTDGADVVEDQLRALLGQIPVPSNRRILIVDDDRFFREVLGTAFRTAGFEVLTAEDGDSALHKIIDELLTLDALVLDIFMPGQTGIELIEKIRRLGGEKDLLLVVMTGATLSDEDRHSLKQFGADEVFPKSADPMDLVTRVNERVAERWRQSTVETLDQQLTESEGE